MTGTRNETIIPKASAAGGGAAPSPGAPPMTVSHLLGEVVWLLTQSATHKHFSLTDLEWMVMPPILLEQVRVFRNDKTPVGYAVWANLSQEAEARFNDVAMSGRGARLRPDEWKSGDRPWIVDLVAPFATAENKLREAMLADLKANVFKDRGVKFHVTDPATGRRKVHELAA